MPWPSRLLFLYEETLSLVLMEFGIQSANKYSTNLTSAFLYSSGLFQKGLARHLYLPGCGETLLAQKLMVLPRGSKDRVACFPELNHHCFFPFIKSLAPSRLSEIGRTTVSGLGKSIPSQQQGLWSINPCDWICQLLSKFSFHSRSKTTMFELQLHGRTDIG